MIDDILIALVLRRLRFRFKYPGYLIYLRLLNDWPWGRHSLDRWYWRFARPFDKGRWI